MPNRKVKFISSVTIGTDFDEIDIKKDFLENPEYKVWINKKAKKFLFNQMPKSFKAKKFENFLFGFKEFTFEDELINLFDIMDSGLLSFEKILTKAKHFLVHRKKFFPASFLDHSIILGHAKCLDGKIRLFFLSHDQEKKEYDFCCYDLGKEKEGWLVKDIFSSDFL